MLEPYIISLNGLPTIYFALAVFGLWVGATVFTILCTFSLNAYHLWLKSRTTDYRITPYALSRYDGHELGFWGTFILWPFVFIIVVPITVYILTIKTFKAMFVSRQSTMRIIPAWFSLEGLAKMLNAGRHIDNH